MKLTIFRGIAHDLANHLDYEIWFGHYKDIKKVTSTNVLEKKDSFDEMCVAFFKEKLPGSFNFDRIKKINVDIKRTMSSLSIKIEVQVDDKTFTHSIRSLMG